jgi:hypothetical protein
MKPLRAGAQCVPAAHQHMTIFTQWIEISRFIRDQLGKIGVAKY